MTELSASRIVDAAPREVWAVLCDIRAYARWIDHTVAVESADPPVAGPGGRYVERSRLLGPVGLRTRWVIDDFEAGRHQHHAGTGLPLVRDLAIAFDVAPAGEGRTRVTFVLSFAAPPLLERARLVAAALPLLRRRHRRSLAALGALVAARTP